MAAPPEVAFGQLLFAGIAFMLLAGGSLVVFLVTYQKRLLHQQLHLRLAEAEHQQQLLTAIIEAQEGERERIGRDLHDGIGSTISTAKLLLNRLETLPPHADDAQGLLKLIREIMSTAVHDVRSISHSLYPAVLARFGLAEALQHLVDVSNETGQLPVVLEIDYPRPLTLAQELALYRIGQELVHNAFKHARGATRLLVQLQQTGARLTLVVEDNGCGFGAAPGRGAGLRSIEVRVQMLQGRLSREAAAGQGARMVVELEARPE
ncbi:sensor histidine kinase [Hymenobacter chitinivorans]|uniref:Signal transduction histidine kinase n=1 Tax=Hymenobacter chitinivorans DSM 11115 TaxID=1121954 RepID=A0A2M9BNL6_9BACT|nr:histidine kinase [Hymenobacter chitinivorans]PJJ59535.1 signal transduction histidine kinase [Hymenobacter chitinivorans DSM 11115]